MQQTCYFTYCVSFANCLICKILEIAKDATQKLFNYIFES